MKIRTGGGAGVLRFVTRGISCSILLCASALALATEPVATTAAAAAPQSAPAPAARAASAPANSGTVRKTRSKHRRRHGRHSHVYVPAVPSVGHTMGLQAERDALRLKSSVALVLDQQSKEVLFQKNPHAVLPIASLTKLMTALVVADAQQPMDELLEVSAEDANYEKRVGSRLHSGTRLSREDMLLLALMSSENRAASSLGRHFPGGLSAFVAAMNDKAGELGMKDTHFIDPTGLSKGNVSSAMDLARLVAAAYDNPTIREFSTQTEYTVKVGRRRLQFHSTNALVRSPHDWQIGLQKTGFTNEAGRCLVMQAAVRGRDVVMVFLDSAGKLTRFADANRVRHWIESAAFAERPVAAIPAVAPVRETTVPNPEHKM